MSAKQDKDEKLDMDEFKYDKSTKGWLGPIVAKRMMATKISKIRANKKKQDELNAKSKLNVKKKVVDSLDVNLEDDDDDTASVDDELALGEPPVIRRPFSGKFEGKYANWRAPEKLKNERVEDFKWNRPAPSAESSSFVSPAQQVIRLKDDLKAKDREISLLRDQLMKSQRENYDLALNLKRFEGDDYDKLKSHNAILKEQVDRVSRENLKLRGHMRQEHNTKLHKLDLENKMNELSLLKLKEITPRKRNPPMNRSTPKSETFAMKNNRSPSNSENSVIMS